MDQWAAIKSCDWNLISHPHRMHGTHPHTGIVVRELRFPCTSKRAYYRSQHSCCVTAFVERMLHKADSYDKSYSGRVDVKHEAFSVLPKHWLFP